MARQGRINVENNPTDFAYGSNTSDVQEIFNERSNYNNNIFADNKYPKLFKTWGEDQYYGILNTKGNTVRVLKSELRPLSFSKNKTQHALNFVADAWRDFVLRLQELSREQIIFSNSPWTSPQVARAWFSTNQAYYEHLSANVYKNFYGTYLRDDGRRARISGIDSFFEVLEEFVTDAIKNTAPLTLSGFLESNYLSQTMSGLIIELENTSYDDDFYKSSFYKDRNYQFVQTLAQQYGFAIDKNIPWRLVADLRNPAMREYMYGVPIVGFDPSMERPDTCEPFYEDPDSLPRAYGYSQLPGFEEVVRRVAVYTENGEIKPGYPQYQKLKGEADQEKIFETLFEEAFQETWTLDMDIFSDYALNFYNTFAQNDPVTSVRDSFTVGDGCPPATRLIERSPTSQVEFTERYGDAWKLKTFYVLRSLERYKDWSRRQSTKNVQSIMNIYNLSSGQNYARALRFAQEKYIGPLQGNKLTGKSVGDILDKNHTAGRQSDISNTGRQDRMRGDLY